MPLKLPVHAYSRIHIVCYTGEIIIQVQLCHCVMCTASCVSVSHNYIVIPDELMNVSGWHERVANARAGVNHHRQSVPKIGHLSPPVKQLVQERQ